MSPHWPSVAWHCPSTQNARDGQSASVEHPSRAQVADAASHAKSAGQPPAHELGTQWCVGEHVSPSAQSALDWQPGVQLIPIERSQLTCSQT
jgi:hypothetical protein